MPIHVITLRYSPELGRFDDSELQACLNGGELASLREHFFVTQDLPHLVCVVSVTPPPKSADDYELEAHGGATPRPEGDNPTEGLKAEEVDAFNRLRRWRRDAARHQGCPPYVLFNNKALRAIVTAWPEGKTSLAKVEHVSAAKAERYSAAVLKALGPRPKGWEPPVAEAKAAEEPQPAATTTEASAPPAEVKAP